jgi:hypothetical protein
VVSNKGAAPTFGPSQGTGSSCRLEDGGDVIVLEQVYLGLVEWAHVDVGPGCSRHRDKSLVTLSI